jgi:hypothetical protein
MLISETFSIKVAIYFERLGNSYSLRDQGLMYRASPLYDVFMSLSA